MNRRHRGLLAAAWLAVLSEPSLAQTDTAFETEMREALDEAGTAGSLIRCTSLFRAFRLYAGDESEIGTTAAARETDLAVASVVIWQNETDTDDLETAFEAIVPMVGTATDLFVARMGANQDAQGSVFDAGIETELTFCNTLHSEMAEQTGE